MSSLTEAGIREVLLDTAERLFAENGVAATSVRAITAAAGANVAAINYYFGSREALLRELISRRQAPLNAERLRRLALSGNGQVAHELAPASCMPPVFADQGLGEVPPYHVKRQEPEIPSPTVGEVLDALSTPAIELCFEHPFYARLASRLRAELDPSLWREYRSQQADVTERFRDAFQSALPGLPPDEVNTRLHYVLGGLQHLWAHCPLPLDESPAQVRRRFLTFFGAGLQAPALLPEARGSRSD